MLSSPLAHEPSAPVRFHSRRDRPFGAFSNFEASEIVVAGRRYATVEHWYQSQRAAASEHRVLIGEAPSPEEAKRLGRSFPSRTDWERCRLGIMYRGLVAKYRQHPELAELLLSTGDRRIHEDADDTFWGYADGQGEDWLGRMLETVRSQLRGTLGEVTDERMRAALSGTFSVGWHIAAGVRDSLAGGRAWLTHLIRTPADGASAESVLRAIGSSGILRASVVVSGERASCFSAAPWAVLAQRAAGVELALRRQHGVKPLTRWGVAIPFDIAREMGAEPVLPVHSQDVARLPGDLQWRVALYGNEEQRDWTYEDEWRFPADVELPRRTAVFLVPEPRAAEELSAAGWRTAALA